MTKESNQSESSLLEAIVYDLKAEIRSLKDEVVQQQQLAKNQVAVHEAEIRSLKDEVQQQLTKNQVTIQETLKAEVQQLVQEEIQKLTAANQIQNAANGTEDNSWDNRFKSNEEIVVTENKNRTTIENTTATIAATPISNDVSNQSNNDAEERAAVSNEKDLKRLLFVDSSHKYLYMDTIECSDDNTSYRVGLHHRVIAGAVIVFQFFCYAIFAYLLYRDRKKWLGDRETPSLHAVRPELCYDTETFSFEDPIWGHYVASYNDPNGTYSDLGHAINTSELLLDNIRCNHPIDNWDSRDKDLKPLVDFTAIFLLYAFLLPDVYESFILITKCKGWRETMVGAIIVLKALVGTFVGIMAVLNQEFKGLSDTFLLIVGLVFIHEVDEKFGYMQEIIEQTRENQKQEYFRVTLQFGCFWWLVYSFLAWCLFSLYDSFLIKQESGIRYVFRSHVLESIVYSIIGSLGSAGIYFAFTFAINALAKRRFKREEAKEAAEQQLDDYHDSIEAQSPHRGSP